MNEFYEKTKIVLTKVDQKKDFKMNFSANDLEKQVSKLKEVTIPLLEKNLQIHREELIENKIEFE